MSSITGNGTNSHSNPSSPEGTGSVGPKAADIAYDSAMKRLSATLQKSSNVRSSQSSLRSFVMEEDDDDYDPADQLPTIQQARNTAAIAMAKADFSRGGHSSTRSSPSYRGGLRLGYDDDEDDGDYKQDRKYNIWFVAFCVLLAALLGTVLGIVLGAEGAMELEKYNTGTTLNSGGTFTVLETPAPSSSPPPPAPGATPAPSFTSRVDDVTAWLIQNDVSDPSNNGAAASAAKWIADDDPLRLGIPQRVGDDAESYPFIQRYALAVLHFALRGSDWTYQFDFLSHHGTCNWKTVVASPNDPDRKYELGAVCDDHGQVESLNLPENNLKGQLVSELGLLTSLKFLALDHNELSGSIPSEISQLSNLDYLALHWNRLQGDLPTWISELQKLRVLGLGNNRFNGSIPTHWYTKLTNLLTFAVDDNLLTGDLSGLDQMNSLERVYLEENEFESSLQDVDWENLQSLVELDLSANKLHGTLPPALFGHTRLEILDLSENLLTGRLQSIPIPTGEQYPLKYLALHDNKFTGPIHNSMQHLSDLTHLDLSHNQLTSTIANHLGFLSNMVYFFVANNPFEPEPITEVIRGFPKLEELSFKNTNRTGTIPHFLVEFSSLVLLDLDKNKLTGTVPTHLAKLEELKYLLINRNPGLTGTVPTELQTLSSLNMLLLDGTSLTGALDSLCHDRTFELEIAAADCDELPCDCCQICCSDSGNTNTSSSNSSIIDDGFSCQDRVFFGQLDPQWENSYMREFYQFGVEGKQSGQ